MRIRVLLALAAALLAGGCDRPPSDERAQPATKAPQAVVYPCSAAKPSTAESELKIELVGSGEAKLLKIDDYSNRRFAGVIIDFTAIGKAVSFNASSDTVCGLLDSGEPVYPKLVQPIMVADGKFIVLPVPGAGTVSTDGTQTVNTHRIVGLVQAIGTSTYQMWRAYPTLIITGDATLGAGLSAQGKATMALLFETDTRTLSTLYLFGQKFDLPKH